MRAPSSPAPSGSNAVPDLALAILAQTSITDKQCRNDQAAEHTKRASLLDHSLYCCQAVKKALIVELKTSA
eukprot:CAMPEP_0183388320 /NCGR_PEP_ID=MMETSP0370-20130417/3963_1 /TAXON_ID=268820 /ORGANISM="Peridinium aciculiferum, Strain PAER-2" /LENGTH=70 /DNA_ID=CAMNT_0025567219 /DNA_START=43 /DNA_END=251 /DNA_ORIENTATION=+